MSGVCQRPNAPQVQEQIALQNEITSNNGAGLMKFNLIDRGDNGEYNFSAVVYISSIFVTQRDFFLEKPFDIIHLLGYMSDM